ncbi:MAG: RHS repeat domain-containing protein, partial [Aggregatilineales bacterium]
MTTPPYAPRYVEDYLLSQVDDTISSGQGDNCRYSYKYSYLNPNYPTLPTEFDKYDLSSSPPETRQEGSACATNVTPSAVYKLTYYNSDGYLEAITDPKSVVTYYTYNANGQLASQTLNYSGPVTGNESDSITALPPYDPTRAANVTTTYKYDPDGRLIDVIDQVTGRDDHTLYDDVNNIVEQFLNYNSSTFPTQTSSQNVATASQYDDSGRLSRITDAHGYSTNFSYDTVGRLSTVARKDASANIVALATYGYSAFSVGSTPGHTQVSVQYTVSSGTTITDAVCYDGIHRATAYIENLSAANMNWNCVPPFNDVGGTPFPGSAPDQNVLSEIRYSNTVAQGHMPSLIINHGAHLQAQFSYDGAGFGRLMTLTYTDLVNTTQPPVSWNYGYDQFGRMVNQSDPLATVGNPLGHNVWQCYNLDNQVIYQVRNPSAVPTCANDDSGIAAVSGAPIGALWSAGDSTSPMSYDTSHTPPTQNMATDLKTWVTYDSLGRQTDTYDSIGRRNSTAYDLLGRVGATIKNNNSCPTNTAFAFDTNLKLPACAAFSSTNPDLNNIVNVSYDLANQNQWMTDWLNRVTLTHFDALGQKLQVTQNCTFVNNYPQSEACNTAGSQPDQNIIRLYQYDSLGKLTAQSDPATNPNPTFSSDGSGGIVPLQTNSGQIKVTYDSLGNVLTVTDPAGAVTQKWYDELGRVTKTQSADSPLTTYTYDGLNRLTVIQTALTSQSVQYTLYPTQRAVITVDGRNVPTRSVFNLFGEPTKAIQNDTSGTPNVATAPDQNVQTEYQYDPLGELTGVIRPNTDTGSAPTPTRKYSYDAAGRTLSITQYANGAAQIQNMIYDAVGRLVTNTPPSGNKTTTSYDALNEPLKLARTANADTVNFTYSYNSQDLQTVMGDSSGTTTYNYDALGRLIQAGPGVTGQTLGYKYNQGGQRTELDLTGSASNNRKVNYGYYPNGSLQTLTLTSGWSSPDTVQYHYLSNNQSHLPSQIVALTQGTNSLIETLGYDSIDRLTSIDYSKCPANC